MTVLWEKKTERVVLVIEPSLKKRAEDEAIRLGISLADIIRASLRDRLGNASHV